MRIGLALAKMSFIGVLLGSNIAIAASSSNFQLDRAGFTNGGGAASSTNYQIPEGYISPDVIGTSSSTNYSLEGGLVHSDAGGSAPGIPTGSVLINSAASHTKSNLVTLNLSCADTDGCAQMQFSNDASTWSNWEAVGAIHADWCLGTITTGVCQTVDGDKIVFARFKDTLGNQSQVYSDTIVLDTTPPSITISPLGGLYTSTQNVKVTTEPGTVYYTTNGQTPTTSSTLYSSQVPIISDTTLKVLAQDWALNQTLATPQTYTFCKATPMILTGTLRDAGTGALLVGATVYLSNGQSQVTGGDGKYTFPNLAFGYYNLSLSVPYYRPYLDKVLMCKEDIKTQDITLGRVESVFGSLSNTGVFNGSVNTATGNYFTAATDIEWPGRGIPFKFTRTYNSLDPGNGPFGFGWTHSYNMSLWVNTDSSVTVRWGNGSTETWAWDTASSSYKGKLGVFNKLIKNGDNTYKVRRKDMVEFNFNSSNILASVKDPNGNTITLDYVSGVIAFITDTVGRKLALTYNADKQIIEALEQQDPFRKVKYDYDLNGNLWKASNRDTTDFTAQTVYTYDANHQLLTITDPRMKKVVTNTYDAQHRLVTQDDALSARTSYAYEETPVRRTKITDALNHDSWHYFDANMYLVQEYDQLGNHDEYTYDVYGNRTKLKDKRGNETLAEFDDTATPAVDESPRGNAYMVTRKMIAPDADIITYATYDADNNPLTKTDGAGNTTTFLYDVKGNLIKTTLPDPSGIDARGFVTEYTRDTYGQMTKKRIYMDMGKTSWMDWTYVYDAQGNQTSVADPLPLTSQTTYAFDNVGRKTSETNPMNRTTSLWYDNMDRVTRTQDALSASVLFTYDLSGNLLTKTDQNSNRTTYGYDDKNRLVTERNALLQQTTYAYDVMDRRTGVTDALGDSTTSVYDAAGNLTQVIDAKGNTVTHSYDANGNRISIIDALGNATAFEYDATNRMVKRTDTAGGVTTTSYDGNGNVLTVTDPLGHTSTKTYDKWTRLLTIKDALNNTTVNSYNALSQLLSVTDPEGKTTSFQYDPLGRLTQVADPENGPLGKYVTATYDKAGNRLSVTDTRGKTTQYEYDELNHLIAEIDPLGRRTAYGYDAAGNRIAKTDPDSNMTTFTFDALNRMWKVTYPDAATVTFVYNAVGKRTRMTDSIGTTNYVYNELGQLTRVTDPFNLQVNYEYDGNGNRTAIVYPGSKRVDYSYDNLNRLLGVTDWASIHTGYTYDAASRLTGQTMGNGATVAYDYDDANRLTDKTDRTSGGDVISQYHYTLDNVGNRTGATITQPLLPRGASGSVDYTYDDANQVVTAGGAIYTFDSRGNLMSREKDGVTTNFQFDYREMLTQVADGTNTDQYRYNGDGDRLVSIRNGVTTRFLLDTSGSMEYVLADMSASNVVQRYYVYGDGFLYSINTSTGDHLYHHYDPVGSTVATSTEADTIRDEYAYSPYGELSAIEYQGLNVHTFIGRFGVRRESNGLYCMRARYYDPTIARFLSRDAKKGQLTSSQTLNLYEYALLNPIVNIDPDGAEAKLAQDILEASAGFLDLSVGKYAQGQTPEIVDGDLESSLGVVSTANSVTAIIGTLSNASAVSSVAGTVNPYLNLAQIVLAVPALVKGIQDAKNYELYNGRKYQNLAKNGAYTVGYTLGAIDEWIQLGQRAAQQAMLTGVKKVIEVYNDQQPKERDSSAASSASGESSGGSRNRRHNNLVKEVSNVKTNGDGWKSGAYVTHNADGSTSYTKNYANKTSVVFTESKSGKLSIKQYK